MYKAYSSTPSSQQQNTYQPQQRLVSSNDKRNSSSSSSCTEVEAKHRQRQGDHQNKQTPFNPQHSSQPNDASGKCQY